MRKLTTILLAVLFLNVFGGQISSSVVPRIDPLVDTSVGLIRGLRSNNGAYSEFLGIPYALVDEENPFAPATPHPGFEEAFNAYDGSTVCPQAGMQNSAYAGHIQCLNLNVYVPDGADSQNRLPVMVYIHGGAFVGGSGTNPTGSPKYLVEKDVVVVFINYRLGVYGFMCTDSPKAPGNIGLKDQLLALRWVKEHIESFGGDAHKITLFGESAGGMSIHLHLLSPHEKLYDQVIIQSGPASSPWAFEKTNNDIPIEIAKLLGFVTENLDEAINFVAKADVELVTSAGNLFKKASQYSTEPLTKACVEKTFEGVEIFVPENPNVAKPIKAKTTPVMIGYTSQEIKGQHGSRTSEFFNNYSFKDLLGFGFDISDFDEMSDLVRHFYIGDDAPSESLNNEITSFASDFVFNHPTRRAVQLLLESDAQVVYQYVFSYVEETSVNTTIAGSPHAHEIAYLFERSDVISKEDLAIVDMVTTLWTNFAKYGNPTPETSDLLPVKWEPVSKESKPYLNIDQELTLKHASFHDRMAFWDLFYKLNESQTTWRKGAHN